MCYVFVGPLQSGAVPFPARAFIQQWDGAFPPDYQLVADELRARGVPVFAKTTQQLLLGLPITKDDLVVGDFAWTRHVTQQLGVPMPTAPDYPDCLKHLLHRKIWTSSLREISDYLGSDAADKPAQVFIKPAVDAKAFAAIIEPRDQMLSTFLDGIPGVIDPLPPSLSVFCAEVVDMCEEHRVYVVDGAIRAVCCYKGLMPGEVSQLDMSVVVDAVKTLVASGEGMDLFAGCGVDFAVIRKVGDAVDAPPITCLVEVNDGFSLGRYAGITGKDYTDLLVSRWKRLVQG